MCELVGGVCELVGGVCELIRGVCELVGGVCELVDGVCESVGALYPVNTIMSGPKETFLKRYVVERTNKAEIRPEEQSETAEICRENLWDEIQLKMP